MATHAIDFPALIRRTTSRRSLAPLMRALGLEPCHASVPPGAWASRGIVAADDVRAVTVAGRSGTLEALLVEVEPAMRAERAVALARAVRSRNVNRLHLLVFADAHFRRLRLATFGLDGGVRHLLIDRFDVRASELEALREMAPSSGESGLELALRFAAALDRSRVTGRFFRDFRARRAAVGQAWSGVPDDADRERNQLALLLLSRLTFLSFLQRRGALAGDDRYLGRLFGAWSRRDGSFYRARLIPLFFGALNRRPEDREPRALALGDLPYLNGGLFEPHALERRFPELDLPDAEVGAVFEALLDRYRFTPRETADGDGSGIDPEVLGRVFEGLMAPDARADTGSFYTPQRVVRRVVREALTEYAAADVGAGPASAALDGAGSALDARTRARLRGRLERIRILDPACGSGAFLLGALERLAAALGGLSDRAESAVRRDIVARSLHGVDLLDDAALLCALRLWLALSEGDPEIRPLPNLDRRIRQGDALVDPLDVSIDSGTARPAGAVRSRPGPELRAAIRSVEPAAQRYLASTPTERDARRRDLELAERRLARQWIRSATRMHQSELRDLRARALDCDLFGEASDDAHRAGAAAARLESRLEEVGTLERVLEESGAVPFFSFGVHFAHAAGGFDLIVSNPPWVRSHRWPDRLRTLAARRYESCRDPGWAAAARLTGAPVGAGAQVDLSILFVERAIRLLAPGGVLAVLLPAKTLRAVYGGAIRRILLRDLEILSVEDHSLDQRSIFRADAFAAILIARRRAGAERERPSTVRVRTVRRGVPPLEYRLDEREVALFPDDPASPWLLAPPGAVAAFRAMQRAGPPLGLHDGLRARRGIMTGRNDVLVVARAQIGLGGLARIEAEGYGRSRRKGASARAAGRYRAWVETAALRPLVRGAGMDAFRYRTDGYLIWCHDSEGVPAEPPPRAARYLARHAQALRARPGWKPGRPLGSVFRLSPEKLGPKVAWHDLSDTLRAAALPATLAVDGVQRELVPLNTVYFVPVPDHDAAVLLAGLLNSLPARCFARAAAERAKDARFRFFAWTVSCLPLARAWREHPAAREIARLSRSAHDAGGIGRADQDRLDRAVAALYGLEPASLDALSRWDAWLRGSP